MLSAYIHLYIYTVYHPCKPLYQLLFVVFYLLRPTFLNLSLPICIHTSYGQSSPSHVTLTACFCISSCLCLQLFEEKDFKTIHLRIMWFWSYFRTVLWEWYLQWVLFSVSFHLSFSRNIILLDWVMRGGLEIHGSLNTTLEDLTSIFSSI